MKNVYLRVGTTYYKKSMYPSFSGDFIEILIVWSSVLILQDHNKDALTKVERYDGFICIPENRPEYFKKRIQDYYNTYHQISKSPKEGDITNTTIFLSHIFGEQKEIGIDYLQLLYLKPTQILPILCLVSKERATGKSTFLKWLNAIFEFNMTFLTNSDFSSQFNSDYTSKLIIAVDEVLFKTDELTERLKYLSTTTSHKTESKGKDKKEGSFFGKFILCSNNETSFIKIDADEIRFWILKIEKFEKEDVSFLNKLIQEIPAFLYFLSNRKLSTENNSRMWFTPAQIKTKALEKLIKFNSNKFESLVADCLLNIMENEDKDILEFTDGDLKCILKQNNILDKNNELKKILKVNWKLVQRNNSCTYEQMKINYDFKITFQSNAGRFYSISKEFICKNFDELMNL